MSTLDMLTEAYRLYCLGWGVHWLRNKSKAPVKNNWQGPTRDDWDTVEADYRRGRNLGVRLGLPSKLKGGGYLANIDVDIKSAADHHRAEAIACLENKFPGLINSAPLVVTGYGFRLFCKTAEPVNSRKLGQSPELTKVYMPSADVNAVQRQAVAKGLITEAELAAGHRIRAAWEVELMSAGRQVVLPPSVHSDTGKLYAWERGLRSNGEIPTVDVRGAGKPVSVAGRAGLGIGEPYAPFQPVPVELVTAKVSTSIVDLIVHGTDRSGFTQDRSAALFSATLALIDAGLTDDEILTVLTDRDYALGETAYEHRKTNNRAAAADWIRSYCLKKARAQKDPAVVFANAAVSASDLENDLELEELIYGNGPRRILNSFDSRPAGSGEDGGDGIGFGVVLDGETAAALETFDEDASKKPWQTRLARTKQGALQPTYGNVHLILVNDVSPIIFRRNTFAVRDILGASAPWGEAAGAQVTDDSVTRIKNWLTYRWKIEPAISIIHEVISAIALENEFHPVRDELEALPDWDGTPRLDTWLIDNFGATKDPAGYVGDVFRKWLVASVKRTYEPGAKYDDVPILEGVQGAKKSMFAAVLFGEQYFLDHLPPLTDKDASLNLAGMRCVEFAELQSVKRNEIEVTKAFISRQIDNVRPPYGRRMISVPRQVVFIGTTNEDEYFSDRTGNRRFSPIHVGECDIEALREDRDQLWAEALYLYRNCLETELYLTGASQDHAREVQRAKVQTDATDIMSERIADYFEAEVERAQAEGTPLPFDFAKFKASDLFATGRPLDGFPKDARQYILAGRALKDSRLRMRGLHFIREQTGGYVWWRLHADSPVFGAKLHRRPKPGAKRIFGGRVFKGG